MAGLGDPLKSVVGGATAKALAGALDLHTVRDLLTHYPRRYAQRGELTDLASLTEGDHVTVLAEVARVTNRRMKNRPGTLLEVTVTDGRGHLQLTFFNQGWREKELVRGRQGLFAGKVSMFNRTRQLTHPDYQLFGRSGGGAKDTGTPDTVDAFAGALIPVYPAAASMASWKIARCVRLVLDTLDPLDTDADPVPMEVRRKHDLIGLENAFHAIHRPQSHAEVARARTRLKWDEAFILQVLLARQRWASASVPGKARPGKADGLLAEFDRQLPFTLTAGQREVGETLAADLAGEHPMHRLLQGDVGSGKTLIALRAMLRVVDSGGQAALLAPTEVLAQQHARSIRELLGPLGRAGELGSAEAATRLALLTGSLGAQARKRVLLEAASGEAGIVVGTHALLEEQVQFADLGLVVVDEQHRFGVEQRDALRDKASSDQRPHLLVMTATPIPRTVAMTVYGDLETSTLTELPAGRAAVATHVVPAAEKPAFLGRAWERLREEVAAGGQAYVVCPRVGGDGGDTLNDTVNERAGERDESGDHDNDTRGAGPAGVVPDSASGSDWLTSDAVQNRRAPLAVLDVAAMLADGPLAQLRQRVLHGRMPPDEKDAVMSRFTSGELDVLVATTVVEVGVDVPAATVMVIMDADRFGVSQLHQLRGRIGRGSAPGLCLLVTDAPEGALSRERLDAVAARTDGFALSRVDLEQRREGDVLGEAQSGRRSSLKLLQLLRDEDLIRAARDEATTVIDRDPELTAHPALARGVEQLLGEQRGEYLEKA